MRRMQVALFGGVVLLAVWGCAPRVGSRGPDISAARWGFVGGTSVARADTEVKNTPDKAIYLTERYSLKAYRIAVPNGAYTVRLHFAETYERITAAGQRIYTVSVEGQPVLKDFDPFQEAGARFAAVVKECQATVADGELTIEFADKVQNPMINGIEVIAPGGSALRINCAATADYTDKAGRLWKKDQPFQARYMEAAV